MHWTNCNYTTTIATTTTFSSANNVVCINGTLSMLATGCWTSNSWTLFYTNWGEQPVKSLKMSTAVCRHLQLFCCCCHQPSIVTICNMATTTIFVIKAQLPTIRMKIHQKQKQTIIHYKTKWNTTTQLTIICTSKLVYTDNLICIVQIYCAVILKYRPCDSAKVHATASHRTHTASYNVRHVACCTIVPSTNR